MKRKKPAIRPERVEAILNHVHEAFVDKGQTNFATPQEMCLVVLKLMDELHVARVTRDERDGVWKNRLLQLIVQ